MRRLLVICMVIGVVFSLGSGKKPTPTVKKTMNSVFGGFLGLVPFMGDPMKFKDPANKEEIHTHLTTISNAFSNARHVKTFNLPGFNPSYEQVKVHLKETLEAFEVGQPDFARVRVRATGQLCISCHTQLKGNRGSFGAINSVARTDFNSDFDYAEFLFLVRNYRKSQRYYNKEITSVLKKTEELKKLSKGMSSPYLGNKIDDSLGKMLTMHTKVKYSPSTAINILSKYEKENHLSGETKDRLKNWISSLKKLKSDKTLTGKVKNSKQLDAFLKNHVRKFESELSMYDGSNDVELLVASGILYRYLYKSSKSSDTPKVLYWVSKIDRLLSSSYLFSLSDLYLKRCITDYSKSLWAKKCYKEYKDQVSHGYTGSSGTFIPKDERDELKRLKKFIQ